jgi:O-antigen/teichoic acid export membrane protein
MIGQSADIIIMDRWISDRRLFGCYVLALSITAVLGLVNSTLQAVAMPFFAARHEDPGWIIHRARKWQQVGICSATVAAGLVFALSYLFLPLLFGDSYGDATVMLVPLLASFCIRSTFHILVVALTGTGQMGVNTAVAAIVMPISVGVAYVLTRSYGIWGAIWTQVIAGSTYALLQSVWGWRVLSRAAAQAAKNVKTA